MNGNHYFFRDLTFELVLGFAPEVPRPLQALHIVQTKPKVYF